jgi:hypothetical protein
MQTLCLIWGILSILGMLVGLIPCLGALNSLNAPLAGIGFIVSVLAYATTKPADNRFGCMVGMICCGVAMCTGIVRSILGGGLV